MWLHGIKLEPYAPTKIDLDYTSNLIRTLSIGGVYGAPRNGLLYRKTAADKVTLLMVMPIDQVPEENREQLKIMQACDHHAFKACAKVIGFAVDESIIERDGLC